MNTIAMNTKAFTRSGFAISAILIATSLMLGTGVVSAGSIIWDPPDSCTTINCGATILHANITSSSTNPGGSVEPFIVQVHSSPQYCLRLDVFNQTAGANLEMVLVAPDGTVWRNDNRSGSDTRPLIVVPSGVQGWYTVHISPTRGTISPPGSHLSADLAYGRYTSTTNPNCANPTEPMLPGFGTS